ncbi:VOC family protein [Fulvivirgaceae bacterium BMA10]|uniref:VOC family protein n=1 Tax=Splendidivirga corallicola TaxID=3051826 RepID=A0ABT8KKU2_9BACT|nr:VOC family protein [Fulvivirgaceae bacterium BMA10]
MITKLSHTTVYVLDQDEAMDFYVNKLGFEVRTDATMNGSFRWLTVGPKDQPDLEIILMLVQPGFLFDDQSAEQMKNLIRNGKMGTGVFETPDCKATYLELKSKGVEFLSEPKQQPYGIEATFKDNSGNWFSLTERPE